MNENAGESVFGENIDEVLAAKIVRHTEKNVEEPVSSAPAEKETRPAAGGLSLKTLALLLILVFLLGVSVGRCLYRKR
jgi:hypothetical protein